VLHVAGVGESLIDEWVGDLETEINPTVGLLAHPGLVDIRITAKADSMAEADRMIAEMEARVRERVPEGLFGADQETLEDTLIQSLRDQDYSAALIECGLGGALRGRMERIRFPDDHIQVFPDPCPLDELRLKVAFFQEQCHASTALGVSLDHTADKHILNLVVATPRGVIEQARSYGGERALSAPWAVNTGLELLRRQVVV
jgi:nicotinamide-nucleotide amidase